MNEGARQIQEHLREALAQALGSMTGQPFEVTVAENPARVELENPLIWNQPIAPGSGRLSIAAGHDLWSTAGQLTLAAAGIDSVTDEDSESTWQEIVAQTATAFCAIVAGEVKLEVTAGKAEQTDREPGNIEWAVFTASCETGSWTFKAGWSQALLEMYDRPEPVATSTHPRPSAEGIQSKTFDLLLDVALPVCVSFGRTSLEVREILKLTTGSIVELNRFMSEPVEVIVNDCVIARGEVVVINGNYGVRITQLSSREDRMKSGMAEAPTRVGGVSK